MKKSSYNPEIDLSKFIFSIIIVLFHTKHLVSAEGHSILPLGYMGTEFFFLVSGYLMAKSALRLDASKTGQSTFSFAINKIKAFYPYFILAFIQIFVIRQYAFSLGRDVTFGTLFRDILLGMGEPLLLHNSGIDFRSIYNGPTWYLSAMMVSMVILLPLLLRFRDWFIHIGSLTLSILLYGLSSQMVGSLNFNGWREFFPFGVVRAMAGIALGCFLFGLVERINSSPIRFKKKTNVLFFLMQCGLFSVLLLTMQFVTDRRTNYPTVILLFFYCLIMFSGITRFSELLPQKLCKFLGKASLVLYLSHRGVIYLINAVWPELSYTEALVAFIAGSVFNSLFIAGIWVLVRFLWKKLWPSLKRAMVFVGE